MASDRIVTAQHVLKAVMELERRGANRLLPEWERLEPDLTEYILESLTTLNHKLVGAGLSGAQALKLYRRAETTVLVSIMALQRAQRDLWGGNDEEPTSNPQPPSDSVGPTG